VVYPGIRISIDLIDKYWTLEALLENEGKIYEFEEESRSLYESLANLNSVNREKSILIHSIERIVHTEITKEDNDAVNWQLFRIAVKTLLAVYPGLPINYYDTAICERNRSISVEDRIVKFSAFVQHRLSEGENVEYVTRSLRTQLGHYSGDDLVEAIPYYLPEIERVEKIDNPDYRRITVALINLLKGHRRHQIPEGKP